MLSQILLSERHIQYTIGESLKPTVGRDPVVVGSRKLVERISSSISNVGCELLLIKIIGAQKPSRGNLQNCDLMISLNSEN